MLTKEQFLKSLKTARDRSAFIDKLYALNIDIIECQDCFDEMFDLFIKTAFTEEGQDWYSWYLYEKPMLKGEVNAWEADDTPIILDTDEDLWEYLTKNNYLR